jgi:hypothetical protein
MTDVPARGRRKWHALQSLATRMDAAGALEIERAAVEDLQPDLDQLVQSGVLVIDGDRIRFLHENLFDHVFARGFVEADQSLVEYLRATRQDLVQRAAVRRILTYQRGTDRTLYVRTLADLVNGQDIRFLIKDVAFAVMQGDDEVDDASFDLLKPFVLDPASMAHEAAWSVVARPQWFSFLDRHGELVRWMASEESDHAKPRRVSFARLKTTTSRVLRRY